MRRQQVSWREKYADVVAMLIQGVSTTEIASQVTMNIRQVREIKTRLIDSGEVEE